MSSTNRGYEKHISDFYITPKEPIKHFFKSFIGVQAEMCNRDYILGSQTKILDPCAGGNDKHEMSYPAVLDEMMFEYVDTVDIREDSRAKIKADYLDLEVHDNCYDIIMSNPPFSLAMEFIEKGLHDVIEEGYVIMLLRLNFFGSQARKAFFEKTMPKYSFIHSKRMSFFPEDIELDGKVYKRGSTDSIEYAHFVWQKGFKTKHCNTFVI